MHGSWGSGKAREVASTRAFIKASNACCASSVHSNLANASETGKWLGDGGESLYEPAIIGG